MKKFLSMILVLIIIFSLAGCSNPQDTPEVEEPDQEESETPEINEEEPQENEESTGEGEEAEEPEGETEEIDIDKYYDMGKTLYDLGLFSGVSTSEYSPNLEGSMNRQEAMKMIVSALGWEPADEEDNPFVDVADWAKPYVARAYMEGIALGTVPEQNIFGAEDPVTKIQLLTFYLRALGYESTYAYDNAERLGQITGISDNLSGQKENLKRYDLVAVTYDTLLATKEDKALTIIEELAIDGVVNEEKAKEFGLIQEYKYEDQRKNGPHEGTNENFQEYLDEEGKLLVLFYSTNEDSEEMKKAFLNAAVMLADSTRVVWVDSKEQEALIEEYNISTFPSVKLYDEENKSSTLPPIPDEDTIVNWVNNN